MKKAVVRLLSVLLVIALAAGIAGAFAEDEWVCQNCGKAGNTGKFCPECGAAKPNADWTCPNCGHAGNTGNFCSECGTARPDGNIQPQQNAQAVDPQLEQIPGETDKVRILLQDVEASSYIENADNPAKWMPWNAADNDESTCWQFSAKKGLKGKSWISLVIGTARDVDEIWFKNGFWAYNDKGKDQYSINARPKEIQVEFQYAGESGFRDKTKIVLKDEAFKDWQRFSTGLHRNVTAVRVSIMSTYKGSYYANDVCLSEVMLVAYAPASTARAPEAAKAATVYESRPEVTGVGLKMKLATRTGPGTEYEEPGTFFGNNWQKQTVRVTGKAWDGSMWWVQVDFQNGSKAKYRAWTGLKRVDVDIDKVKEVKKRGTLHVDATEAYCGPGKGYAKLGNVLFFEDNIDFYGWENGFVEIDYYDVNREIQRRCWVSEKAVSDVQWK